MDIDNFPSYYRKDPIRKILEGIKDQKITKFLYILIYLFCFLFQGYWQNKHMLNNWLKCESEITVFLKKASVFVKIIFTVYD